MENKKYLTINVLDYAISPGPRYCNQGDCSGEDFYHKVLNAQLANAIRNNQILQVNLDGPDGYASSFLDEAFGNLVYDFGLDVVTEKVEIISREEPEWITMLKEDTYQEWEIRRIDNEEPHKTVSHLQWFRLVNGKLEEKVWISPA